MTWLEECPAFKESVVLLEQQLASMEKVVEMTMMSLEKLTKFCKGAKEWQRDKEVELVATLV